MKTAALHLAFFGLCALGPAAVQAGEVYDPPAGPGRYILTPEPAATPRIHGAAVFGVRPGAPFLYAIPATGQAPLDYQIDGLPAGLQLDRHSGHITGRIAAPEPGRITVTLKVSNSLGSDQRKSTLVVGDTIQLTPALGWNSWNSWGNLIDQDKVLASAKAMVDKGLAAYGWTYINIDDCWQGQRGGPDHALQPNSKFPDMKAMTQAVHALGLKVGIYSTPWVTSYAGFAGGSADNPEGTWLAPGSTDGARKKKDHRLGKFPFAANDARQWADWGIDYLKYDWSPNDPASIVKMADALKASGRDINYSLSNSAPIEHAALIQQQANSWRTTGDLKDRWDGPGSCLNFLQVWDGHRKWLEQGGRGGPGHFPDADMLVVGDVVEGNVNERARPSRLTPDEQYTHISLWSLWSAPMLIGCPIEQMDAFTRSLLTNSEVLAIQQDEHAVAGRTVFNEQGIEIVVKELADGSKAFGLFNRNAAPQVVAATWKLLDLDGPQGLRDVWRQKDLGHFADGFAANVPAHGVILIQATKR